MNYLLRHPEVVWSGIGIFLLGGLIALIRYLKKKIGQKFKVVRVNEYIDVKELTKGLIFENGIYINRDTAERFCPLCLDTNKLLIHLTEKDTPNGKIFECYHCGKIFLGEDYNANRCNSGGGETAEKHP